MAARKDSPTLSGADTNPSYSTTTTVYPSPASSPGVRRMSSSNSNGSINAHNGGYFGSVAPSSSAVSTITAGSGQGGHPASSYYPSFPIRNKSRTSSVSSTSTIQASHNLLHSSQGILLPKRQPTTSSVTSSAVTTVSATAFSTATTQPYTLTSASSSSSSLSSLLSNNGNSNNNSGNNQYQKNGHSMNGHHPPSSNGSTATNGSSRPNHPVLVLEPLNNTFALKTFELPEYTKIKIGRQTGVSTAPGPTNGYFDSKVLSRVHAEVWSENGKVYLRDLKSSNGTFLNGRRLCPEGVESEPFQLNPNDTLEFGIDIMDENGTMLHEKVACRIFISRLALSSSGSPPNDGSARLRSGSTASMASTKGGQGAAGGMTNGGGIQAGLPNHGGGQDSNFDLLVSRLQHELVRSQETNGDLQNLRQGLDDLGKIFVVTKQQQQQSRKNSMQSLNGGGAHQIKTAASLSVDYERLLDEKTKAHAAELEKVSHQLETVQSEMEQQLTQKNQDMALLVAESDALRKELAEAMAEMTKVKLERDQSKDMLTEMAAEQTNMLEALRKEQEAAVLALEAFHATAIERLTNEARKAQEDLVRSHREEMTTALETARREIEAMKKAAATNAALEEKERKEREERMSLEKALQETRKQVETLEQTVKAQQAEVQLLKDNREGLTKDLQAEKEKVKELTRQAEHLATLTPTSPTSTVGSETTPNGSTTLLETAKASDAAVSKRQQQREHQHEFTWSQFVFPMAKRNQPLLHQPSTMLMSGGFMLVGLGAYVLWHRAAGITPP